MLPGDERFKQSAIVCIPRSYPSPFLAGRHGRILHRHWRYVGETLYATVKLPIHGPNVLLNPDNLVWLAPDAEAAMAYILDNPDQPGSDAWRSFYQDVAHQELLLKRAMTSEGLPVGPLMDRVWVSSDLDFVLRGDREKMAALSSRAMIKLGKHYIGLLNACERLAEYEAQFVA